MTTSSETRLRKALEPFANMANALPPIYNDGLSVTVTVGTDRDPCIYVGDLRRASAALASSVPTPGEPDQWAELERAVTDNIAAYGAHSLLSIRNVYVLTLIEQARGNSAGAGECVLHFYDPTGQRCIKCGHEKEPAPTVLTDDERDTLAQAEVMISKNKACTSKFASYLVAIINRISAPSQGVKLPSRDDRQTEIAAWVRRCFGDVCMEDGNERGARVLEEAIELAQAAGLSKERADHLVAHVYSKPVGAIGQEIGGVAVTLLSFAAWAGLSAEAEELKEVTRVLSLPVEHFKKRHREKAAEGITRHPDIDSVTSKGAV